MHNEVTDFLYGRNNFHLSEKDHNATNNEDLFLDVAKRPRKWTDL